MKLLITRPREDGLATAAALHRIRVKTVLEPLYRLEQANDIPSLGGPYQGLIFTSRNGVKSFARLFGIPDLPCFCVGDRTAEAARELGFRPVHSANGDAQDLVALVQQHCPPAEGPLFRAAGDHDDDPLTDALTALHYVIDARTLYRAVPVARLQRSTSAAIQRGFIDGVVFFSPAAAHHFKALAELDYATEDCARLDAFCISDAAAQRLDGMVWRSIQVAEHPSQDSLLQLIDQHAQGRRSHFHSAMETMHE